MFAVIFHVLFIRNICRKQVFAILAAIQNERWFGQLVQSITVNINLNKAATRLKAKQLLSRYRTERGYAHMPINPRVTARISNQPVSTVESDPYALERVQRKESGQAFIDYINQAIQSLPLKEYRWLLIDRFCNGYDTKHPDMDAIDRLNNRDPVHYSISQTKYYEVRKKALLEVASYLGCLVFKG